MVCFLGRWERTEEPFFAEEERERRLESLFEADVEVTEVVERVESVEFVSLGVGAVSNAPKTAADPPYSMTHLMVTMSLFIPNISTEPFKLIPPVSKHIPQNLNI